jgi:hypothetical protein
MLKSVLSGVQQGLSGLKSINGGIAQLLPKGINKMYNSSANVFPY